MLDARQRGQATRGREGGAMDGGLTFRITQEHNTAPLALAITRDVHQAARCPDASLHTRKPLSLSVVL